MMRHVIKIIALVALFLAVSAGSAAAADKVLERDTGKKDGQMSRGGTGHVISFEAPRGTWWIKAVRIFGTRYGKGYVPEDFQFTVSICDEDLEELTTTRAGYDLFQYARYQWVEVPLEEPIKAPKGFRIVAAFDPKRERGIFVGWSTVNESHSALGLANGSANAIDPDKEWMIRPVLSKSKPKTAKKTSRKSSGKSASTKKSPRSAVYLEDFEYIKRTVRSRFPALRKKGVDWNRVCREWEPRFRECPDDATHVLNAKMLLAVLKDSHTDITRSKVSSGRSAFDNFYGGGLWMASDRGRLVLRGLMEGHHLRYDLDPGAVLVSVDGRPARIVHEEDCRRIDELAGYSSRHFLEACMFNRFFFMEKEPLPAVFLNPDGKAVDVKIPRWGPGGRSASPTVLTLPESAETGGYAAAVELSGDIGYIRILGGMNTQTQKDFFEKFDTLKGKRGIILDCRGMGGGGDSPAWAMAGRFYPRQTPLGTSGKLDPSGDWQFEGPVVMIQNSLEISSAETFTWSMTETGRAVSVGRPTGGATIIPRSFDAPSGIFSFRMGCRDRPTPINGIKPEGIGTAPDVPVPFEPALLERHGDPDLAVARDILLLLLEGASREAVTDFYGGVLGADAERVRRSHEKFGKLPRPSKKAGFADVTKSVVPEMIEWEILLAKSKHNPMPDFAGASERLADLAEIARMLGHDGSAGKAASARSKWKDEIAAQAAWENLIRDGLPPDGKALEKYLKKHARTRYGKAVESAFD